MKKYWRRLNAFLFLAAFLAPWVRGCNNDINGYQATSFMGSFTFEIFTREILAHPNDGSNYIWFLITLLIFVGLVCILFYALVYLLLNLGSNERKHFYTRIFMLFAGIVGMISIIIWLKETNSQKTVNLKDLLWGYWLTWAVLGSSILLESINRLSPDDASVKISSI